MNRLKQIFNELGLNRENGLYIASENNWQNECRFSRRLSYVLSKKIKPDAFFVLDNKPLVLFYDNPINKNEIFKAIWNFNESPIIIFVSDDIVEIYNGFEFINENNSLKNINKSLELSDISYFELVSGNTWKKHQALIDNSTRVDRFLLKNIKSARDLILVNNNLTPEVTNALIGKIIFVRYLIDRKVKIAYKTEHLWSNDDLCKILDDLGETVLFFQYLEQKFNGDMFKISPEDYQTITESDLRILVKLLREDNLENGLRSLFNTYDFSIIPIEFISNVYESFIGEDNQENEGAYYTPLFLVDYILNNTVEKFLEENPLEYNCIVLDPACGSGIFLVESLRKIIERYSHLYPEVKKDSNKFKKALHNLVKDNIYGVDKNLAAIQVAIFSIQLTLLDYQDPSSIEGFRFPKLLGQNFFEADFFDVDHKFNEELLNNRFDFIIGNPPWKRGSNDKNPLFIQYITDRRKRELIKDKKSRIDISNNEIAQAFLLRVSDFNVAQEIALIATSKVLYNLKAQKFRNYFLENYFISRVFELAPVRKYIFDNSSDPAIAPAVVLFYKYSKGNSTDDNLIKHIAVKPGNLFKMFKVFSISRNDSTQILQVRLKEFDWLWKVLVYGSFLDFNFIKRLKYEYRTIRDEISDKSQYISGHGVQNGKDKNDASALLGKKFLDTNKIQQFYINKDSYKIWDKEYVHRPRKPKLYEAPILLLKKGLTNEFKMISAISTDDIIYKDFLYGIKALESKKLSNLRCMSAITNSPLFPYLAINTFSSVGIEREQVHAEKLEIPYFFDEEISTLVSQIESLKDSGFIHFLKKNIESEVRSIETEINEKIFDKLDLSKQELALIEYANNITIPMQMNLKGYGHLYLPIKFQDESLNNYAELFIDRFSQLLKSENKKLIVEVWYTSYALGMFFKVVDDNVLEENVTHVRKNSKELVNKLISISTEKITDKLFVQKDLRGFENDYFYIFKPNEKRLWHEAVGYQDLEEIVDAILRAGKKN